MSRLLLDSHTFLWWLGDSPKLNDDARNLDEVVARCEADLQRIAEQLNNLEASIAALLAEGEAPTEQEFLSRADIYRGNLERWGFDNSAARIADNSRSKPK